MSVPKERLKPSTALREVLEDIQAPNLNELRQRFEVLPDNLPEGELLDLHTAVSQLLYVKSDAKRAAQLLGRLETRLRVVEMARKERAQALEDLDGVIDKLQDAVKDADPEVPRGDAPALVQTARTIHHKLTSGTGNVEVLHEAALKAIQKLRAVEAELLEGHRRVIIQRYRAELKACQLAASKAGGDLDAKAVEKVEATFEEFRTFEYFVPPRVIDEPMAAVREALNYVVQFASTARQRLQIDERTLNGHDALCGKDTVRKLLGSIKPGRLTDLGPGPMGLATPKYDYTGYPKVNVSGDQGHFRLEPSEAKDSAAHECTIMPIGDFTLGKIAMVQPGKSVTAITESGDAFTYRLPEAAHAWADKWLKRGVTPEAYREVELRELEHLVDFDYAFKVGPATLAAAIKRISQREFDSPTGPIDALVGDLSKSGAAELIPADPYSAEAWTDRMSTVMLLLSGMSKERDTQGTHSPAGNRVTVKGDSVVIHPVFGTKSLDAKQIISLAKVGVVYTGRPPPKDGAKKQVDEKKAPVEVKRERKSPVRALKQGDSARVVELTRGLDLCEGVRGTQVDMGNAQPGLVVRIEEAPTQDGLAWASVPEEEIKTSGMPDGRAYFQIKTRMLE